MDGTAHIITAGMTPIMRGTTPITTIITTTPDITPALITRVVLINPVWVASHNPIATTVTVATLYRVAKTDVEVRL